LRKPYISILCLLQNLRSHARTALAVCHAARRCAPATLDVSVSGGHSGKNGRMAVATSCVSCRGFVCRVNSMAAVQEADVGLGANSRSGTVCMTSPCILYRCPAISVSGTVTPVGGHRRGRRAFGVFSPSRCLVPAAALLAKKRQATAQHGGLFPVYSMLAGGVVNSFLLRHWRRFDAFCRSIFSRVYHAYSYLF